MKHFQQYFCFRRMPYGTAQHGLWYRYAPVPGNWHVGTPTRLIATSSATAPTITQIWNDPCQVVVWSCDTQLTLALLPEG